VPNGSFFYGKWLVGLSVAVAVAVSAPDAYSQPMSVSYQDGLITIRCSEVTLAQVFEEIKSVTGLELILEDPVKSKRLTADIEAAPVNLALERLLAGVGVNYAMIFDREDWQRVDKIFIGEGGGPVASRQPPPARTSTRRAARRPAPADPDPDDMGEDEPYEDMDEAGDIGGGVQEEPAAQPGTPSILPPPPAFPRSSSTPGLESSPFGAQTGGTTQQQPGTNRPGWNNPAQPPAYYPFTDQFGRPIPVPTDPNASQQQGNKGQQNQQEQQ
jgi:hypothetical protein